MAPDKYLSTDLDPFFESLTELFNENSERHGSKKSFRFLRTVLVNFLAACSERGVSRAKATHSITFQDGSSPETTIPRPPAWLKIDTKARNSLTNNCGSPTKFVEVLSNIAVKQSPPIAGPKRKVTNTASRPRKRRQKNVADQPQPTEAASSHQSEPNQASNAEGAQAEKHSELRLARPVPGGGSETQVDPLPSPNEPTQREQEHVLQATSAPSPEPPGLFDLTISSETVKPPGPIEPQHEANTLSTPDTCLQIETYGDDNEQLVPMPPKDDAGRSKLRRRVVFLDINPSKDGIAEEDDPSPQLESQTMDLDDTAPSPQVEEDEPPPPNPFINALNLAAEIMDISASSWEEYRPKLIEHILDLGLGHTAPCASLQPEIAGTPFKRMECILTRLDSEISKIPPSTWESYKTQLLKFSQSARIQTMGFLQRLWEIGRIIYVSEEEAAMASRDWERLKNAALLCALLAESMGKENEDICEDWSKKWLESKLRDIKWLEKALDAQTKVGNILASASST